MSPPESLNTNLARLYNIINIYTSIIRICGEIARFQAVFLHFIEKCNIVSSLNSFSHNILCQSKNALQTEDVFSFIHFTGRVSEAGSFSLTSDAIIIAQVILQWTALFTKFSNLLKPVHEVHTPTALHNPSQMQSPTSSFPLCTDRTTHPSHLHSQAAESARRYLCMPLPVPHPPDTAFSSFSCSSAA